MRDFASCFSEHAVNVSDSSCSGRSSNGKSSVVTVIDSSSIQAAITSLYRAQLSTQKDLLIKITWSRTQIGQILSIGVDDDPYSHHWNPSSINSQLLRKKRGTHSYISGTSIIGLYWDYSIARFNSGPEPGSNFYVVVIVDAEFALLIGDSSSECIKRFEDMIHIARFSLVSRREQVVGQDIYSTKAKFSDDGKEHEIVIMCNESELMVIIDKKRVVIVRKLQWNFRGYQTIYIDKLPVDMMWDVRDWLFSSPQGYAVFMFRKRRAVVSVLDSSLLWFEEEILQRERGVTGFSLLIQAFKKNP